MYTYLLMLDKSVSFSHLQNTHPLNMLSQKKFLLLCSSIFLYCYCVIYYSTVLQASFLVVIMVLEGVQQTDSFSLSTSVHVIQQR